MGMFAKPLKKKEQFVRNSTQPAKTANQRQEAKTERARNKRKRLNASRKANKGNQFAGVQNRKRGRNAPLQIELVLTAETLAATEYGRLMLDFVGTVGALS